MQRRPTGQWAAFFNFETICPTVKAPGPQTMRCAPCLGMLSIKRAVPRAAKIASVATLALLAIVVLPYNPYGFGGVCPIFIDFYYKL